jgi:glycosyltransferase involved in cell wall biosynthesis
MTPPVVSIVMPSYNQACYLEEAVRSVLDQSVPVELIVQDPGSSDGSRELLTRLQKEYCAKLILRFEPDDGQSDAVNRGLALARGRIFGWLNSDDRLRPGALQTIIEALERDQDEAAQPRWLYGRTGNIDANGQQQDGFITSYKNWRGRRFSRARLLTENFIPQMAVFFERELWQKSGGLDTSLNWDMDYDLWFRFARESEPLVLEETLSDFRIHGQAKGSLHTREQLDAAFATASRYAPELGLRGIAALWVHRAFSLRTRIAYRFLKPHD